MGRWVLWVGLAGCGGKIKDVAFVEGASSGTGEITFSTKLDGSAWVEYGRPGEEPFGRTPVAPAADGRIQVLGLPSGDKVEFTVVVAKEGSDREAASDPLEVQIGPPVRSVIPLVVDTWNPDLACDPGGYVLFSFIGDGSSGIGIIDREANYVFSIERPAEEQIARVRPGRDGRSLLYNYADAEKSEDIATIVRTDLLGNELTQTRTEQGHHDFVEKPDGRLAWLAYDQRTVTAPPNNFDLDEICLAVDTLYEADEGAGEGEFDEIWNAWNAEDYPSGIYAIPRDSVRRNDETGTWDPSFLKNCYEFGHGNSLGYVASQDAFYTGWRWLDTVLKISGAGDLVWQWGGQYGDLPGNPDDLFEHSHFSEVRDGGIMMFDNRNRQVGSRLTEFTLDDTAGYELAWEYPSPDGAFENILGDVRTIPIEGCDNLIVSWSGQGRIQEITRDGQIVWDVTSPVVGNVTSRLFFVPGDPGLYDLSGLAYAD